jgi:hypothetical protein
MRLLGSLKPTVIQHLAFFMRLHRLLIGVLLSFGLLGCATVSQIPGHRSDYFKFEKVRTYSTFAPNSAFYQQQNIADDVRNMMDIVLEQTLAKKHVHHTELAQADVIVSYFFVDGDNKALAEYNKLVHLCVICEHDSQDRVNKGERHAPGQMSPSKGNRNEHQRQASRKRTAEWATGLIVDFIDPKTQRSVWRVYEDLTLSVKDNSRTRQQKITEAIEKMLTNW